MPKKPVASIVLILVLFVCMTASALWFWKSRCVPSKFTFSEYIIENNNVCYHKDCTFYDGIDYRGRLCRLDKKLFGYREIEGADPSTFIKLPQYSFAMDKSGFYQNGNKESNADLGYTTFYLSYFLNYCQNHAEKNNTQQLSKLCEIIKVQFEDGHKLSTE